MCALAYRHSGNRVGSISRISHCDRSPGNYIEHRIHMLHCAGRRRSAWRETVNQSPLLSMRFTFPKFESDTIPAIPQRQRSPSRRIGSTGRPDATHRLIQFRQPNTEPCPVNMHFDNGGLIPLTIRYCPLIPFDISGLLQHVLHLNNTCDTMS